MHVRTIIHDLGKKRQVHHEDMYILRIWYSEIIIIIDNK